MKNWRELPITEKQKDCIERLREYVPYQFHGNTRGQAADYINDNINLYNDLQEAVVEFRHG